MLLYILARLGDTEAAEQSWSASAVKTANAERYALLQPPGGAPAQGNPTAAAAGLAPVLDGSVSALPWGWLPHAFLLEAIAQDKLGRPGCRRALERALGLAEPDSALFLFLVICARPARNAMPGSEPPTAP